MHKLEVVTVLFLEQQQASRLVHAGLNAKWSLQVSLYTDEDDEIAFLPHPNRDVFEFLGFFEPSCVIPQGLDQFLRGIPFQPGSGFTLVMGLDLA